MARKPNYSYERFERDRNKAAKKQAKAEAKAAAKGRPDGAADAPGDAEREPAPSAERES